MKKQGQAKSRQAPSVRADKLKVLSALTASVFALSAQAAATEAWVATSTKAHDPAAAVHVAPLKAGEQVNIVVSLKLRNKAELDALTSKLMAGASGAQPLTSAQFMAKHAPTAAQAQEVVAYLRAQGFTNIEVASNNLLVSATGSAAAIRTAFKADLHEYNVNGRRAYANVTDAMVPAHLSSSVLGVVGLQNVHMMHTHARRLNAGTNTVQPMAVSGVSIPNFASIYGASSLPSATSGTIGIITAGSLTQTITDLKSFASSAGYPVPNVTTTVVGTAGTSTSGTDEWNMDSQSSLAAAGGSISQMILYNVTDLSDASLTAGYNKAVTDNKARAINVSLGGCESSEGSVEATQDAIFQSAVSQGQMFSVSSGDSGAYECGATAGKAQSYPAVSPYVMAIGGTTLSSSGGTWQGETVWSCSTASTCQQSSSGGAGGGPSLAAPLWAGFWTRIQAAHGNTLAYPASAIYSGAAANPGWFHDVTSGNQGYAAGPGWDYASGYGSVQIAALSASLGGTPTPPPPPPPAGPTANFSDTVSGLTVSFVDTSTDTGGTITSRSWNFGDSSTSTAQNPSHTYAAAGTYSVTETVTDSNANSASHTASVTVSTTTPPPPPPSNLVTNGGFENGSTGWTMTSGVDCTNSTCSGETAHSGTGFAWLDGYGTTHTDTVTQSITIPAGKTSATLTFYLHVDTAETTTTTAYDKLTISATPSGGSATTLATYSNLNAASGYVLKTISLNSFIGKTITLKFSGTEDASLQTSFVMDDVSVTAQ